MSSKDYVEPSNPFAVEAEVEQGLTHHSLESLKIYRAHVQDLARGLKSVEARGVLERNRKIAGGFIDNRAASLGFDVNDYAAHLRATLL